MTKRPSIKGITDMVGSHLAVFIKDHREWKLYRLHRWFRPLVDDKKVKDSELLTAINVELQLSTKKIQICHWHEARENPSADIVWSA